MLFKSRLRILTPVNGTQASENAFRWSCQLARNSKAELHAIYVFEIPLEYAVDSQHGRRDLAQGEKILKQVEGIASEERYRVSASMIAARNAGPAIVLEADSREIDLLVIGVPNGKTVSPVAVGSTADFILKRAPCQVILSREPSPYQNGARG